MENNNDIQKSGNPSICITVPFEINTEQHNMNPYVALTVQTVNERHLQHENAGTVSVRAMTESDENNIPQGQEIETQAFQLAPCKTTTTPVLTPN